MNKKTRNLIIAIAVVLVVLLAVYFIAVAPNKGAKAVTLEVEIEGKTSTYTLRTDGEYVIDVLNELNGKKGFSFGAEDGSYGKFVNEVNGRKADDGAHEYYALYINGDYASFGVSEQVIADGDVIKLVLEKW